MKKLFLITVITLIAFASVYAQNGVSFGLRVIPTFNWTSLTDTDTSYSYKDTGTNLGFGFGPSFKFNFSDNFNIDVSGIFTWQKFGINQTNEVTNPTPVNITEDFKIQYLQIPVNLNGQFYIVGDLQALINFGLGAGIKLNSYRVISDEPNSNSYSTDYEEVSVLTFADIYLTAGAGVVYNIVDNVHVSLTCQYNHGVLDGWYNNKNEDPSTIQDLTLKHRNIGLSIGFYIDI